MGGGDDNLKSLFGEGLGLMLMPRITGYYNGAIYLRCLSPMGLGELRNGMVYTGSTGWYDAAMTIGCKMDRCWTTSRIGAAGFDAMGYGCCI